MATKKTTKKKDDGGRQVIIGHGNYGLCYGTVSETDEVIADKGAVTVKDARHIAHWKGEPGGLTSLASHGPRTGSRIGHPCPSLLVREVKTVLTCTEAAVKAFDALAPAAA